MEVFKAGEALLPFLAPTIFRNPQQQIRLATVSRHCRPRAIQCQTSRAFTTSIIRRQDESDMRPRSRQDRAARSGVDNEISSMLDSALDFSKGSPTARTGRTSHFASKDAQQTNPPSRSATSPSSSSPSSGSSMEDLLNSMTPSSSARAPLDNRINSYDDLGRWLDPDKNLQPPPAAQVLGPAPMKLGPSLGRTIEVNKERGMDVGRAFRTLEVQCARNSVKRDFQKQRFHERAGMKRKRLHSERWRKRFKEGFRGMVRKVMKMKKQGW